MRRPMLLPFAFLAVLLVLLAAAARAEEDAAPGWTTTVKQLAGSERRPWFLALVSHPSSRHVTLVVAPVAAAGREGAGTDGENIERSESGDLHQIALWAEQLRKDAQGWKRPSLRDRPPASPHVIGVVRSAAPGTTVQNAEHGGGRLAVGDLLFVEDVCACGHEGTLGLELLGAEDRYHHRWSRAELVCAAGARVGLRGTSDEVALHLHGGTLRMTCWADGLRVKTAHATIAPEKDAHLLLTSGATEERIAVRTGLVLVESGSGKASVAGGTVLSVAADGTHHVVPLDETLWAQARPEESTCTRDEALRLVSRVKGHWRGQPRNASITLDDDGRWRSYERLSGRSDNKGGAWEPRPGGVLELTWVWTPHRSKTPRTDVYRYLLEGDALVRLRPGGAVFLRPPPRD